MSGIDVACPFTLTTPASTIEFNDQPFPGITDMYFLTATSGLDDAPIRAPADDRPQADGGIPHKFWQSAFHITLEGEYLIQSTRVDEEIQAARNLMHYTLRVALKSMLRTPGSLAWTPGGVGVTFSLEVLYEQPLSSDGIEQKTFSFGLYAAESEYTNGA